MCFIPYKLSWLNYFIDLFFGLSAPLHFARTRKGLVLYFNFFDLFFRVILRPAHCQNP